MRGILARPLRQKSIASRAQQAPPMSRSAGPPSNPDLFDCDDLDDDLPPELVGASLRGNSNGGGGRDGGSGGEWWRPMAGAKSGQWQERDGKKVFVLDTGVVMTGQAGYKAFLRLRERGGRGRGRRQGRAKRRKAPSAKGKGERKKGGKGGKGGGGGKGSISKGKSTKGWIKVKKE